MKKILLIILLSCNIMVVKAADFNTYLSGSHTINPESVFNITFNVKNASDLYGVSADIEYDYNKLELVSSDGLNGFNLTCGNNKIVLDSAHSKSGNFSLATFKFKASSSFELNDSTTITIKSIEGGNGDKLFNGNQSSIKITVVKPKDNNNKLKSFTVENNDINFNPDTNVYYLKVNNETKDITISAISDSNVAKVEGTGTFPLNIYDNNFQITVTAEDGSKNVYQLIVSRADEEGKYALLKSPLLNVLSIDGYIINFKNDNFNYNIEIDNSVEDLNIFAFPQMSEYEVKIDKPKEFIIGENIVRIHVTDAEGNESDAAYKTYNVIKEYSSLGDVLTNAANNEQTKIASHLRALRHPVCSFGGF